MAAIDFSNAVPLIFNVIKWLFVLFIFGIIVVVGVIVIINIKKRKWHIEIWEQKADLTLHKISDDILTEKKLKQGKTTVYWLQKLKLEVIPPPTDCVYRWKNKDYVKYLRIERDYIPTKPTIGLNYNDPEIKRKATMVSDKILKKIRSIKTSFFDSEPVRDRFIYIPSQRTLSTNFKYQPIDYDMSMMAQNKIEHADEFFKMKGEWWAKYGAYILFGVTIVFLIIIAVLTYDFVGQEVGKMIAAGGQVSSALENVAGSLGGSGAKPPI